MDEPRMSAKDLKVRLNRVRNTLSALTRDIRDGEATEALLYGRFVERRQELQSFSTTLGLGPSLVPWSSTLEPL